ncbi:MAG: tetratricopeptide repeat protein, partial [Pirellulaceae bacterium]
DNDQALQLAGTWEVLNGDKELGIRLLELAVFKNPRNHGAVNNLAFSIKDKNLARALELANLALANQPNNVNYIDTRVRILMQMDNYADAIVDLDMAIKRNGDNADLYRLMAECYRQQGLPQRAQEYVRKADEVDRD